MTATTVESGTKWPPGGCTPEGLTDTGIGGIGMTEPSPALCECGCGEPAPLARDTDPRHGYVRGEPVRFVRGHQNRSPLVRAKISQRRAEVGNEALKGRPRPPEVRAKVSASKRGIPNDRDRQPPRDGDKLQARRRVRLLVRVGQIPRASDLPCTDCGRMWQPGEAWHGYDHYLGYDAEHHEHVEPVCIPCHNRRERARKTETQPRSAS